MIEHHTPYYLYHKIQQSPSYKMYTLEKLADGEANWIKRGELSLGSLGVK